GSWGYSILPYLEAGNVHRLGAGLTGTAKRDALTTLAETPVGTFYCPSRRPPAAYRNADEGAGPNLNYNFGNPPLVARSDYAANLGPNPVRFGVPPNVMFQWAPGPTVSEADQKTGFELEGFDAFTWLKGVTYQRSEIQIKH